MIEKISIDYDGPDGNWLNFEGWGDHSDDGEHATYEVEGRFRFQLNDEICAQLNQALEPWREHIAEGERYRVAFEAHTKAGLCSQWISGQGPCKLPAGHQGEHAEEGEQPWS